MINQQLLDFIKSQLLKGLSKNSIISELKGNGWNDQDIQEGFSSINTPLVHSTINPNVSSIENTTISDQSSGNSAKKLVLIIVLFLIITGGVSGYYFRNDIPIIKDLVKNKEVALINEIQQVEKNQTQLATDTELPEGQSVIPNEQKDSAGSDGEVVTKKTVEIETKGDSGILKYDIKITTDVTNIVDCGDENCFVDKFASCLPSKMTSDIDGMGAVFYQIIGPQNGGCSMIFKYTQNPNPDWVNKEMTCVFDNKIELEKATEKVFNSIFDGSLICTGPLYSTMRALVN